VRSFVFAEQIGGGVGGTLEAAPPPLPIRAVLITSTSVARLAATPRISFHGSFDRKRALAADGSKKAPAVAARPPSDIRRVSLGSPFHWWQGTLRVGRGKAGPSGPAKARTPAQCMLGAEQNGRAYPLGRDRPRARTTNPRTSRPRNPSVQWNAIRRGEGAALNGHLRPRRLRDDLAV
jgi:hypothetical protein